jgi:RNA 3'-phosphate cyclase
MDWIRNDIFSRELGRIPYSPHNMSATILELDGSMGEGGGQILRSSLALSLLTGKAFHLANIRAGRDKPGLQPQHLQSVRAAAAVGGATLRGDSRGSTDLTFTPGPVRAGSYRFDIGTAGATSLVLQTIALPLALRGSGPSELTIVGGTHVSHSPTFHFLDTTWRAYLAHCGLRLSLRLVRPGYYPRGGGEIKAFIPSCSDLRGPNLKDASDAGLIGFCAVAGLQDHITRRQIRRLNGRLEERGLRAGLRTEEWEGGPANVVGLEVGGGPVPSLFCSIGARGKPAEDVADEALDEALAFMGAGPGHVDPHSADQLVLPLALARGPSSYRVSQVTDHLTTNISVVRRFVDREIVCTGQAGGPGEVRIA